MAEMATYVGIVPRTIITGATALARGVRVTKDSAGVCAVAVDTVRGDFVTLVPGAIGEAIAAVSMSDGGKIVALAGEAGVDAGDTAYAFANGKFGVTSAGGVAIVGRWTTTTAINTLGEVELFSVI